MGNEYTANLIGIGIRPAEGGPMQTLERAHISLEQGLHGDKRNRPGRRQITLMSHAAWQEACNELDHTDLRWTTRRANLLVDELPLYQTRGHILRIGEVMLEITGETDPCSKMEAAQPGLFQALVPDWRGGVTCKVVQGGEIVLGMSVVLTIPTPALDTQKA